MKRIKRKIERERERDGARSSSFTESTDRDHARRAMADLHGPVEHGVMVAVFGDILCRHRNDAD